MEAGIETADMDPLEGTLSAAEKKTIAFGLAVAIVSSSPTPAPLAGVQGCPKQRASKQLRLWQGACLGDLAEAGSRVRALGAVALSGCQSERARAVQNEALEGMWHGDCSPDMVSLFAKEMLEQVVLRGQGNGGQVYRQVLDLMVSIAADVAAAAAAAASSGSRDNAGASAVAPAARGVASTPLTRRMEVGLAVSHALDTTLVQLARQLRRGLGGGGGGGRVAGTRGSSRQRQFPSAAAIARAAGAGLYLDAYEAVVAFLLRAFRCLAEGDESEEQQESRASRPPPSSSSSFFTSSSPRNGGSEPSLRPKQPPPGAEGRGGGRRPSEGRFDARNRAPGQLPSIRQTRRDTTAAAASEATMMERGVLPRGWDATARRNAWTQRKLEVLAEATTTMASFRMGQLRIQRIVARVYEWAREDDEDATLTAEDAKRLRALSPSSAVGNTAGGGTEASRTTCTGSHRPRPLEKTSIYKLTSPWLTMPASKEEGRTYPAGSMEKARGARALCFGGGEEEEEEEEEEEDKEKRFFSLRTSISNVSSAPSEPVDIPGARGVKEDSGARNATGVPSACSLEEEGWVSLWNTYTRLFPGTFIGCSPPDSQPPPDSPLYAASPPSQHQHRHRRGHRHGHALARASSSRRNLCPSSPSLSSSSFLGVTSTPTSTSTSTSAWTPLQYGAPGEAGVDGAAAAAATMSAIETDADASTDDCFAAVASAPRHSFHGGNNGNNLPPSWTMTAAATTTATAAEQPAGAGTRERKSPSRRRPFAPPPPLVLSHSPFDTSHSSPRHNGSHRQQRNKQEKPHKNGGGRSRSRSRSRARSRPGGTTAETTTQEGGGGENPPARCSWGHLSRLPLEEAGKVLGTFSAKGFSAGIGRVGVGGGGIRGVDGEEEDDGGGDGEDEDPEDVEFGSDTDVESSDSEDLMFELEM
eukprot:g8526.t1